MTQSLTNRTKQAGRYNSRDESAEPFCTPKAAAEYLDVTPQVFEGLRKQYGVGRYHLPRDHDQIVYSMNDLARIKDNLAAGPAVKA